MYNLADGEHVRDFGTGGPCSVLALSVDANSTRALAGSVDGRLRLWQISDGACLRTIEAHTEDVTAVQVDWTSGRALSGSSDGTVKAWNIESGELLATCKGGSTPRDISASWADHRACCGMDNGVVRMWDIRTGALVGEFTAGRDKAEESSTSVSAFAIDCAGRRAVTGLKDGHLVYWHFGPESSPAAGSAEPAAKEAEAAETPAPKVFLAHYIAIRAINARWLPQGSRAFVGSDDGSLSLWRLDTQQCTARFARHVGFVWAITVDWAKERALSGAFDGCTKLWNLRTGQCLRTMQAHSRPVQSVAAG
jgi:WD40 repeat protein